MLFDDGDANSIDNLLNDLDEVVESNCSSLTSSSSKQPHFDNSQSLFSHSFNQNKTRLFTPHPPSIPKAAVSNSQSPPESTTTIQPVQSQQVLYNPKTRFAVDHHRKQNVDQSSGSIATAATAATTRSDNRIGATEYFPPPALMALYDSSSPSPPPLGARDRDRASGGGTTLNKTITSSSGTARGADEQQQQQRDENSVDRLLNLLSSPTLQRSDSQTDGYSRPVVTTESTIYYSKSHNITNTSSSSSSSSSSSTGNNTKTSYFKPSRDNSSSSSSSSSSDLPSVIAVADSSSSSSYWGVRDRVSSWDEIRTNSSSSDTRDRDRDINDSIPLTAVATTTTGYNSSNNTLMFQRTNSSSSSSSHMSLGSLSGTRLGEQQLSVQSTGIMKGFLPDKIGSISATSTTNTTGSSSYAGSSQNSSSKARCSKVVIAGAAMERGRKVSSFSKLACSSLRCMKCNFKVLCFIHYSWDSTVDYMFLRNTVPNETKLSQKLLAVSGSSAYCCQCTWVSEAGEKELNPSNPASPQWVCSGH